MSVHMRTTRRYIPEDEILFNYRCQNLRSEKENTFFNRELDSTFLARNQRLYYQCYSRSHFLEETLYFSAYEYKLFIPLIYFVRIRLNIRKYDK
jgi:hypothetical protein